MPIIGDLILLDRRYKTILKSKPIVEYIEFEFSDNGFKLAFKSESPSQMVIELINLIERHKTKADL